MKQKQKLLILLMLIIIKSYSQTPSFSDYFSWKDRFGNKATYDNYISPAKDQGEQSPCHIFAAVAAVEAMSHIYYNKPFHHLNNGIDLAEREIYSWCSGYEGSRQLPLQRISLLRESNG